MHSWDCTKLNLIPLSCPEVKQLTHLDVSGAGPVLLGAEGPAGGVAWSALGAHLGLQQAQLHQHRAVQTQAHLVCSDWPRGRLDRRQDANCSGMRPSITCCLHADHRPMQKMMSDVSNRSRIWNSLIQCCMYPYSAHSYSQG